MSSPSVVRRPKANKKHLHRVNLCHSPATPSPIAALKHKTEKKDGAKKAKISVFVLKRVHRTCVPKYHFYRFSIKAQLKKSSFLKFRWISKRYLRKLSE